MAVFTDIEREELDEFLRAYDLGAARAMKGIAEGVENSNFFLLTERGPFILTLFEKRVTADDLPYFIALMRHLAGKNFPCPAPIAARDGAALRRLKNKPAVIVSFLEGEWPRRPTVAQCRAAGAMLARLHNAARDFPMARENDLSLDGWARLITACGTRANDVQRGLAQELAQELDALRAQWPTLATLPQGAIHADFFPDNVFFQNDAACGVIDFYFACRDALAYDLAIAINAWCFEADHDLNVTKAQAMRQGYESLRPLSPAEQNALPILMRGATMRFIASRLYDWLHPVPGALVRPKDPMDYVRRLRFHQMAQSAVYGHG